MRHFITLPKCFKLWKHAQCVSFKVFCCFLAYTSDDNGFSILAWPWHIILITPWICKDVLPTNLPCYSSCMAILTPHKGLLRQARLYHFHVCESLHACPCVSEALRDISVAHEGGVRVHAEHAHAVLHLPFADWGTLRHQVWDFYQTHHYIHWYIVTFLKKIISKHGKLN